MLALALVARVWDLQNLPFAIHPDEPETGDVAIAGYLAGQAPAIFSTLWATIDLPALWFVQVAGALEIGGGTLAALRLPAALYGAATILPFYGLVRETWGRGAAVAGGVIFAVSAANVHYSRVTLNNIVTPFFWALCCYFLLRGVRRGRPVDWVLAGIAGGLGEYSFYGTRLLPFLLIAFGLYLLVVHWRQGRRMLGHFALLALGYLAGFGPLLAYLLTHPAIYFGRGAGKLTWDHLPRDWADAEMMVRTLGPLVRDNLLGFVVLPGQDGVYWSPLLLVGEAALLVLGVALLVWQWRQPAAFLLLLGGAGVLFVGGTLVRGTIYQAHWTPAFPLYYAALAVPLGAWLRGWQGWAVPWRWVGPAVIGVALLGDTALNADFYGRAYGQARPEFLARNIGARWAAAQGPGTAVYSVGRTWQALDPSVLKYLVAGQTHANLLNPARALPLTPAPGGGLAFLFARDNLQYLPIVQHYYPGGSVGTLDSSDGVRLFDTYTVPAPGAPAQAPVTAGLLATLDTGSGPQTAVDPFIGFTALGVPAPGGPPSSGPPQRARWIGTLQVPQSGETVLELRTDGAAQLVLDGQPANGLCVAGSITSVALPLAAGPHTLQLDYIGRGNDRYLELYWTPPGGTRALVPPPALAHAADAAAPALPDTVPCARP